MEPQLSRWERLEELFHFASELPEADRAAFLQKECGGDVELRREVEALLNARTEVEIESAIAGEARNLVEELRPGDVVAGFRIEALLGRGGMGSVYRAVRADQDFNQRVAIKLVQSHLRAEEWMQRFLRERQILARLEHPNIARLLDGGSANGRPYIVMEYVEGRSVDRYVIEEGLSAKEKVGLFRKVCGAVSYAHGQLVVHRDIKPQNILVGGDGEPKLLDFGIAKPMEETVAALTRASERILTPQYAAPEQVLGEAVTTATDVYALGALLYHLLAGRAPFESTGLSGFALEKAILEQEPAAPGTLVKLDADLDQIVAKAMRKEAAQRYGSVVALEQDLDRFLGGYPVEARRGSWQYRAGKFLKRRAGAVVASTLVVGTLLGGVVSTKVQQQKAERRLQEVRELANRFLFEFHDSIVALPGATKARQMVVARAVEYLGRLEAETGGDIALERDLAAGYERIRDIQFGILYGHLNDVDGAMASGRRAIALRKKLMDVKGGDPEAMGNYARANLGLAYLMVESGGSLDEVKTLLEEGRKWFGERAKRQPDAERQLREETSLADMEAVLERALGDATKAVAAGRKAVALQEKLLALRGDSKEKRGLASTLLNLGDALLMTANLPMESIPHFQRAVALYREEASSKPSGGVQMEIGQGLARVGLAYAIAGRHEEALPYRREALRIAEETAARDPENALTARDLAVACINAAQNEYKVGSKTEAVRLARRMLEMFGVALRQSPESVQARMDYASALEDLSDYLVRTEARKEPEALLKQAISIREEDTRKDPKRAVLQSQLAHAYTQVGDSYGRWGDKSQAEAFYRRALDIYERLDLEKRINGLDLSDWDRTKAHLADLKKK